MLRSTTVLGPVTGAVRPRLVINRSDEPVRAAVLVLHGGREQSISPVRARHLSVVRMVAVAGVIRRGLSGENVAVARLRFGLRGWNEHGAPVVDATWALEELRERLGPVPVVLVGHSMGGRTAVRVAGFPTVTGIVALAAWLPKDDQVEQLSGRALVLVHGTRDTWVPATQSESFAERARPVATDVRLTLLPHTGHFMARRATTWHRLVVAAVRALL